MDPVDTDADLSQPDTTTPAVDPPRTDDRAVIAERKRREAAEAKLRDYEVAAAERTRKEAERQGEYQRLYETERAERERIAAEHTAATAKLAAIEQREAAAREARKAKLPEQYRALIPDGITAEAEAAQIERLEALAATAATTSTQRQADDQARSGGSGGDPDALTAKEEEWCNQPAQRWIPANASAAAKRHAYLKAHPKT